MPSIALQMILSFCLLATAATTTTSTLTPTAKRIAGTSEVRHHYAIASPSGEDDFAVTEILRLSEQSDSNIVLIEGRHSNRYIYSGGWDFEHQVVFHEFAEPGTDNKIRATRWAPFTTKTRSTTLDQGKKNPAITDADHRFEITVGKDIIVSGMNSYWKDLQTARQWRTSIRQSLSPTFLERIEILDSIGLFSQPFMGAIRSHLIEAILYRTSCEQPDQLRVTVAPPDCRFDKSFGFKCSEDQEARASKAAEATPPQATNY